MNDYEAKQQAKRERLEDRATKLQADSERTYKHANAMASVIPMGQPIMVGHYSEGRDRRYRERIHNTYGKAFALSDAAKATAARAESVGTGGISSDDPDAVVKLRAELAECEAAQERMKAANATIRKHAKAGTIAQIAALVAIGYTEQRAGRLLERDCCGRIGFPDYATKNNGANIRRIAGRIEQLLRQAVAAEAGPSEVDCGTYRVVNALDENRLRVFFPGKPCEAIRSVLKSCGFRWAPSEGAWQRFPHEPTFQALTREDGCLRRRIAEAVKAAA